MYTVMLDNMMFGGSSPTFAEEFTWCNYIIKYYTIGCCGLCGFPVKVWVDKCIVMGEPKFDEEMAKQDARADAANPKELSRRFSNQSASGPPSLLDPTRSVSFVTSEEQNSSNDVELGGRAPASEVGIEIAMVQAPSEAARTAWGASQCAAAAGAAQPGRGGLAGADAKTEADDATEGLASAGGSPSAEARAADAAAGLLKQRLRQALQTLLKVAGNQAPKSLAALLAECGLEHLAHEIRGRRIHPRGLAHCLQVRAAALRVTSVISS